jgi:hypothetical protein
VIVVVIMRLGFWFGFGDHLLEFTFQAFAMNRETTVFRSTRGDAVHEVGGAALICAQSRGDERKMRRATAFVRRGAAVASKTHSNKKINE